MDLPDLNKFLSKYDISKPFLMVFFIHLYTDYKWFIEFLPNYNKDGYITLLNGTKIKTDVEVIYEDYTKMNKELIFNYNLDLNFLIENTNITSEIDEIDTTKLYLLTNFVKEILNENNNNNQLEVFKIKDINSFIQNCSKEFIKEVECGKINISKQTQQTK